MGLKSLVLVHILQKDKTVFINQAIAEFGGLPKV